MTTRHPLHDLLVDEVRRWYETSYAAQGYFVEPRAFGFYGRNVVAQHPGTNQVTVRNLTPNDVPVFLADLGRYYGSGGVFIFVDNRRADTDLSPALLAGGCRDVSTQLYLAHVGPSPRVPQVQGLTIEPVIEQNLHEFVIVKIKAFEDSEAEPDPERVQADTSLRRAEMRGGGSFRLARLDGEPAGIIGWYEGPDRFVFILATRVPYRGRGIGRALLADALADAYASGCRSSIINVDPEAGPIDLYRALGFSDEVYWRHRYRFGIERQGQGPMLGSMVRDP